MHQQQTAFEKIVGKGGIVRTEQFLLFPHCFLLNQILVSLLVHIFDIIFLFAAELEEPKIGISGKGLKKDQYILQFVQLFCSLSPFQTIMNVNKPDKGNKLSTLKLTNSCIVSNIKFPSKIRSISKDKSSLAAVRFQWLGKNIVRSTG